MIKRKRKRVRNVIFLLLIFGIVRVYIDNNLLQISHYTVKSDKISRAFNGFKILQLSDLHSRDLGKENQKLIDKINGEKPDIVVMTGDMINAADTNFEVFIHLAKQISENYNTYYIVGNHEQILRGNKLKSLIKTIKAFGIKVIDNKKVTITKGKDSISLYGLWINLKYYKDARDENEKNEYIGKGQVKTILGNIDKNSYNILLTHNPLYFDTYANWGADLTLTGHIHGGMIRIPFMGGMFSPERKLFPKYSGGKYKIGYKELIVNRGLGNGEFPIRIFNRPEISVVTLMNK